VKYDYFVIISNFLAF